MMTEARFTQIQLIDMLAKLECSSTVHSSLVTTKELVENISCKGISVLDVGCGNGSIGIACALKGASSVLCIDNLPEAIELTNRNIKLNVLSDIIEARISDLFEAVQNSEQFDLVVCDVARFSTCVEKTIPVHPKETPEVDGRSINLLKAVFKDARKHLKPNGKIIFTVSSFCHDKEIFMAAAQAFPYSLKLLERKWISFKNTGNMDVAPVEIGDDCLRLDIFSSCPDEDDIIASESNNWARTGPECAWNVFESKALQEQFVVRFASPDDLPKIGELRYKVFAEEQGRTHFLSNDSRQYTDAHDKVAYNLIVEDKEEIVGCVRITRKSDCVFQLQHRFHYSEAASLLGVEICNDSEIGVFDRGAVNAKHRGAGLYHQMYAAAYAACKELRIKILLGVIESENSRLAEFHKRQGWRVVTEKMPSTEYGQVTVIARKIADE